MEAPAMGAPVLSVTLPESVPVPGGGMDAKAACPIISPIHKKIKPGILRFMIPWLIPPERFLLQGFKFRPGGRFYPQKNAKRSLFLENNGEYGTIPERTLTG